MDGLAIGALAVFAGMLTGLGALFRSPRFKEWLGDFRIHRALKQRLRKPHYFVFRDVILPARQGTVRIPHMVVSRAGVFVIETNHLPGWIYGQELESFWAQSYHREESVFESPLRINQERIQALKDLLGNGHALFRSIVIFAGRSEIRSELPVSVMKPGGLLPYIQVRSQAVIEYDEMLRIIGRIERSRLTEEVAEDDAARAPGQDVLAA